MNVRLCVCAMACMWRSEDNLYESDLSFYHVNSLGLHSDYLVWWQAHLSTERPCCSLLFMQISVCLLNNFWNFCLAFINLTSFVENCFIRDAPFHFWSINSIPLTCLSISTTQCQMCVFSNFANKKEVLLIQDLLHFSLTFKGQLACLWVERQLF